MYYTPEYAFSHVSNTPLNVPCRLRGLGKRCELPIAEFYGGARPKPFFDAWFWFLKLDRLLCFACYYCGLLNEVYKSNLAAESEGKILKYFGQRIRSTADVYCIVRLKLKRFQWFTNDDFLKRTNTNINILATWRVQHVQCVCVGKQSATTLIRLSVHEVMCVIINAMIIIDLLSKNAKNRSATDATAHDYRKKTFRSSLYIIGKHNAWWCVKPWYQSLFIIMIFKPGFHYPSWRPELTGVKNAPELTGRQLGPWTRVVKTGL